VPLIAISEVLLIKGLDSKKLLLHERNSNENIQVNFCTLSLERGLVLFGTVPLG